MYSNMVADELFFNWDDISHIARHSLTIEEIEELFDNDPMDQDAEIIDGEQRYSSVGHT